jgi:hypothetical protein
MKDNPGNSEKQISRHFAIAPMIDTAMSAWGRVDILVNNAGILRDKTFAKMGLSDFQLVIDVHRSGQSYQYVALRSDRPILELECDFNNIRVRSFIPTGAPVSETSRANRTAFTRQ